MKTACIQLNGTDDMAQNIAKIKALVKDAAEQGAKLIALPENCFLMEPAHLPRGKLYTETEHPGLRAAEELAEMYHCWLLVGSAAIKVDDSGKTVNRSIMYNDKGQVATAYDKIHLFDVELPNGEKYLESDRVLYGTDMRIATTPWGKVGLSVCYDLRFPHFYRAMAKAGATILAVPAAFTALTGEAHWHVLLRARAIENGCFVIAPAQTGTHYGKRQTYGHSLIIDPWGKVIMDAGTKEGVIVADLDMGMVERVRKNIPSLSHDRDFA